MRVVQLDVVGARRTESGGPSRVDRVDALLTRLTGHGVVALDRQIRDAVELNRVEPTLGDRAATFWVSPRPPEARTALLRLAQEGSVTRHQTAGRGHSSRSTGEVPAMTDRSGPGRPAHPGSATAEQ